MTLLLILAIIISFVAGWRLALCHFEKRAQAVGFDS